MSFRIVSEQNQVALPLVAHHFKKEEKPAAAAAVAPAPVVPPIVEPEKMFEPGPSEQKDGEVVMRIKRTQRGAGTGTRHP